MSTLYKFKSAATGDLIMLEPSARRILEIIGKDVGAKGIVLVDQMDAALSALEAAIALDDRSRKATIEAATSEAHAIPTLGDDHVSLRQRAKPFVDMLARARAADADIVWGV